MRGRTNQITIRLSDKELADPNEKAGKVRGFREQFIRQCISGAVIKKPLSVDLPKLIQEVRRVGSSLNQILRITNSLGLLEVPELRSRQTAESDSCRGNGVKEQERKDRTNRLCKRIGLFEKLLPDTITLTEEQFKTFLEQTAAAKHGRRLLEEMTAQNAARAAAAGAGTAEQGNICPAAKAAHTPPEDGAGGGAAQG